MVCQYLISVLMEDCDIGQYSLGGVDIGSVKQTFVYDRTFGADPIIDVNGQVAWDSIVPCKSSTQHTIDTYSDVESGGPRVGQVSCRYNAGFYPINCPSTALSCMLEVMFKMMVLHSSDLHTSGVFIRTTIARFTANLPHTKRRHLLICGTALITCDKV